LTKYKTKKGKAQVQMQESGFPQSQNQGLQALPSKAL